MGCLSGRLALLKHAARELPRLTPAVQSEKYLLSHLHDHESKRARRAAMLPSDGLRSALEGNKGLTVRIDGDGGAHPRSLPCDTQSLV